METQTTNSVKLHIGYFFLSVGVLIGLITSVVSFLNLVFETLNKRFPDVLNSTYQYGYSTYEYENIRMALATLIIVFPIFLALSYFWNKFSEMGRWDVMVKRWQINIILFLASVAVVIGLVTLVRYFISGEITERFVYKVLTVLVVALIVGFYYVSHLKDNWAGRRIGLIAAIIASALVLAAIVWSFTVMGSPMKQRLLRLDDRRIGDLQNIQYQVINFWQQKEKLPENLKELANPLSGYSLPVDPEFEEGKTYEYNVKGPLTFELCATFSMPIPKGWREYSGGGVYPMMPTYGYREDMAVSYPYPVPYPGGGTNESWDHEAGRTCFERTIDKDIYPPYPKPLR